MKEIIIEVPDNFGKTLKPEKVNCEIKSELVRCKDCIHWDKGHTEECGNPDSVCFHNGWCKPDWYCPDGEMR
jgi:hypothetical protein